MRGWGIGDVVFVSSIAPLADRYSNLYSGPLLPLLRLHCTVSTLNSLFLLLRDVLLLLVNNNYKNGQVVPL